MTLTHLLKNSQAWLAQQMQRHAAVPIVYRRGTETANLVAVVGRKEFAAETTEGRLYFRTHDWLIDPATLVLNGVATTPQRGDQIVADLGHGNETFAVLPESAGPAWEWSDPFQSLFRVHTQKVS